MKPSLICGGLLVTACSAVAASDVTVYGDIDQYVGYIRSSSGNHITGLNDGAVLRSRLGLRGTEDLGGGYQAKFVLENGLGADTGTQADSGRLFDRQAWLGIETPAGEFRAGRQNTIVFYNGAAIDYSERTTFGAIINSFGVPSRYDNDLSYKTPRLAGWLFELHYALPENSGAARNKALYQVGADYQNGPWRAGYGGLAARPNGLTATVPDKIAYHNLYANYNYGAGKVYLAAVRSNNVTASANGQTAAAILNNVSSPNNFFAGTDVNARRYFNIYQLSADYKLSAQWRVGALGGKIVDTSGGGAGARGVSGGAFYDLSKRTILYGFVSYLKNDGAAGFRFSSSAGPSANLAGADINGKSLSGLQTGILHRF